MPNIQINVPWKEIQHLLCSAFEGGSNYWYFIEKQHKPSSMPNRYAPEERVYPHVDFPTNPGGWLLISDAAEEGDAKKVRKEKLDMAACERGLKLMAEKWPHRLAEILSEDTDGETSDVFLQLCLFGDVIYG